MVFKAPDLTKSISDLAWFPKIPEQVIEIKVKYDNIVTDFPTKEELEKQYNQTLSWALDLKGKIIDWVLSTKDNVDSLRETMSWAQQKIESIRETYNEAKEYIDIAEKKIEETKKIIEDTSKIIDEVKNIGNITHTWVTQ